jgi:acyl-CoA dehydrogenase
MFGGMLADLQLAQAKLAEMAVAIDAAALLTYRAAWLRDVKGVRTTKEAAMAKWTATESAQEVIDAAVQMFGALGVTRGQTVERLTATSARCASTRRDRCAEVRRARALRQ